ncbi:MAG: hypothetical protein ABSE79_12100 [Terriglobia bacterium]|jgi:hypothetical protein
MSDLREQFKAAGFEIVDGGSAPGSLGVRKYGCVRYLEPQADQQWLAPGPPYFQIRGLDCELEDKGYQKFWRHGDTRFPIRKTDLQTLHRFDEEVREILQLPSLYNESLGSTCAQTDYDRLEGRPDR